jgi:multicomponent Na+:H+ antiporter subunit B
MTFIDYLLWLVPVVCGVLIAISRKLVANVILLSIFSISVAVLFLNMAAPDVAITEAAIGAAISTIFFLATLRITGDQEDTHRIDRQPALIVIVMLVIVMLSIVVTMPEFGAAGTPANSHVGQYYIEKSLEETGIPNAVTAVLASYRGFDTLGELFVIFTAGLAVLLILPLLSKNGEDKDEA